MSDEIGTDGPVFISARPVNHVTEFTSSVDIIIPFYGQYEKVMRLMDSIFRLTRSNYYNLILVDDHSPNADFLSQIKKNSAKMAEKRRTRNIVQTVRNSQQLGWGGACKAGFEQSESSYVCFLNSDCIIDDSNWLRRLGESLISLKSKNVRVVSAMADNIVGGDPAQESNGEIRQEDDVLISTDSYLSLYCFMCHRQLFGRVGGFIKSYPYGGYEDQEFAHRMHKMGFRQAVSRGSFVRHEGAATLRDVMRNNPMVVKAIDDNRNRCIADMKELTKRVS